MFKAKFLLVAIMALPLCFISCSDDDDDDIKYPKTLNYKKAEVVEFKMYVGSEDGGKEVSTAGLIPSNYWSSEWLKEDEDWAKGYSIKFIDNDSILLVNKFDSEQYLTKYKFEGDKLYIHEKEGNEWSSDFMWGNKNKIIIKSGFTKYNKITADGSSGGSGSYDEAVDLSEMVGENKTFKSLSEMKHKEDTVMWYNINHIYE